MIWVPKPPSVQYWSLPMGVVKFKHSCSRGKAADRHLNPCDLHCASQLALVTGGAISDKPAQELLGKIELGVEHTRMYERLGVVQVVVTMGVALASYGEIRFVILGVILQVSATMLEATRLVLVQVLLQVCFEAHPQLACPP